MLENRGKKLPNFFGFLKDGLAFFLLPNVKKVRVQFFVVVIYLEECAPVGIHQVFCIYLQHKTSRNSSNGRGLKYELLLRRCEWGLMTFK